VHVTLGEVDMDVAATLASLGNARSSATLSDRERKLLKIRYRNFYGFLCELNTVKLGKCYIANCDVWSP